MKTNLKDLATQIMETVKNKDFFTDNNKSCEYKFADDTAVDFTDTLDVSIIAKINNKKEEYGNGSINFKINVANNEKPMIVTMYISEKKFGDVITFVNDISHDLVVASSGKTALDNALKHSEKYLENSIKSMLGLNTFKKNYKNTNK